jgi:NTP pyrophosphatase (non-canonical NTP hydrolase)
MEFNDYQKKASRTLSGGVEERSKSNLCMGLAGEAGEVIDLMKKHLYHGHDLRLDEVQEELGDVLWYVAGLCEVLGLEMSKVAESNILKLQSRYPEGFSEERSVNRNG